MAISGLFTFAWTTGEMFNVVHLQRELTEDLSERRREKKAHPQGEQVSTQPASNHSERAEEQ